MSSTFDATNATAGIFLPHFQQAIFIPAK